MGNGGSNFLYKAISVTVTVLHSLLYIAFSVSGKAVYTVLCIAISFQETGRQYYPGF